MRLRLGICAWLSNPLVRPRGVGGIDRIWAVVDVNLEPGAAQQTDPRVCRRVTAGQSVGTPVFRRVGFDRDEAATDVGELLRA